VPELMARDFPHTLNLIAEAAGEDVALQMALEFGGSRIRIPVRAEGSKLAQDIGIDAARLLVDALSNERIEIPPARRQVARWLRDSRGWSQEQIAKQLHASRRSVQNWLSDDPSSGQFDLFDKAS
jgi:DNA-binding transcriptional regulator YiaG